MIGWTPVKMAVKLIFTGRRSGVSVEEERVDGVSLMCSAIDGRA